VQALAEGTLEGSRFSEAERALLEYAGKVTEAAYKTTPEDVQVLREHGWTEPQIAEAVYVTAMFAFFNRVADAFGIQSMRYLGTDVLTKAGDR
jgi:alkylhydroperoxidase family enzyme